MFHRRIGLSLAFILGVVSAETPVTVETAHNGGGQKYKADPETVDKSQWTTEQLEAEQKEIEQKMAPPPSAEAVEETPTPDESLLEENLKQTENDEQPDPSPTEGTVAGVSQVGILLEESEEANVEVGLPTLKVKVYQFMLPEKNEWSISNGKKKICEGGPYTNWYAEAPTNCKLPTGSYTITCCDTRSKEGWTGGYVLIEGDNQKLCEKFNWGAGKKCYTQKFGVVVPTPKPTPVPTPKPTPDASQFGMYDFSKSPGAGWVLVNSLSELNKVKDTFINFYNKHKGIPSIKNWKSTNCCWTFSNGIRVGIDNKYMYPWQKSMRCNGAAYSGTFQFWYSSNNAKSLALDTKFTEVKNCADNNNPGIYRKTK